MENNKKYGEIKIKTFPSNIEIYCGIDEERGRVLLLTCTGDEPILGYTDGISLGNHVRSLSRRGQINFIRRYSA